METKWIVIQILHDDKDGYNTLSIVNSTDKVSLSKNVFCLFNNYTNPFIYKCIFHILSPIY